MDRDEVAHFVSGVAIGIAMLALFNRYYHRKYILPAHSNLILEEQHDNKFLWDQWKLTDGNCVINRHMPDGDHLEVWRCP